MDTTEKAFLHQLRRVTRHAAEQLVPSKDPDDEARPLELTEDQFYSDLYEERQVEKILQEKIHDLREVLCVVGARGSGKTTLAKRMKRLLSTDSRTPMVVIIDCQQSRATGQIRESEGSDVFRSSLDATISNHYREEIFPYSAAKEGNPELLLLDCLLNREYAGDMPSVAKVDLAAERNEAQQLYEHWRKHERDYENSSFYKWLAINHVSDPNAKQLLDRTRAKLKVHHFVFAARHLNHYTRQVIWLDNLDQLGMKVQSAFCAMIRELYGNVSQYAAIVLSIREENVLRTNDLEQTDSTIPALGDSGLEADSRGAPFVNRVVLEIGRDAEGYADYPSANVPEASAETVRGVLTKRLSLALRLCREEDGLADTPEVESRIQKWSELAIQTINDNGGIFLANNSIRDLIFMFRDFLARLLKEASHDRTRDIGTSGLATRFFSLIGASERDYQVPMPEPFTALADFASIDDVVQNPAPPHRSCLLNYLLVSTVYNLTYSDAAYGGSTVLPNVAGVLSRLKCLGFTRDEVRAGLYRLYAPSDKHYRSAVDFRTRHQVLRFEQLRDDHIVYLTCRGKQLFAVTYNTFGFVAGCLQSRQIDAQIDSGSTEASDVAEFPNEQNAWPQVLDLLSSMARMHYTAILSLRSTTNSDLPQNEWLTWYYTWFGMPQLPPFVRADGVGRRDAGIRRTLLFEGLAAGLGAYAPGTIKKRIATMLSTYLDALNRIGTASQVQTLPL